MKSLYEVDAAHEIAERFGTLHADSKPLWGKMNVSQMAAHCVAASENALGELATSRTLLGRLIGRFFRAQMFNDKPWGHSSPTAPEFVKTGEYDFEAEKAKLVRLIGRFHQGGRAGCTKEPHCFFGDLTPEEWGKGMYKHLDHHLRQFGA